MRNRTRIHLKHLTRRSLQWLILPLAALFLVRLGWGMLATHKLNNARAAFRARGLPATLADLPDPAQTPAAENAAVALHNALSGLTFTPEQEAVIRLYGIDISAPDASFTPEYKALIKEAWQKNADFAAQLDQANALKLAVWPRDTEFLFGKSVSGILTLTFDSSNLLCEIALVQSAEGNHAASLRNIRRILWISRIMEAKPLLIINLVATAQRVRACYELCLG